ncbi:MAG: hypothetical protein FWC56_01885 [Phycisphaerae bacterium]|nr:hypothetical protein [Phycisphaerae bacterium]
MKKVLAASLVLAMAATSFGSVVFTLQNDLPIQEFVPVVFTVSVENSTPFNAMDLVVGSDSDLSMAFEYSAAFKAAMPNTIPAMEAGVYASDLYMYGSNTTNGSSLSLVVGTLTIAGLPEGTYGIKVDSDYDGLFSSLSFGANQSPLFGSASFNVVPEPASALLLLAGLPLLRRRK